MEPMVKKLKPLRRSKMTYASGTHPYALFGAIALPITPNNKRFWGIFWHL